MLLDAREFAHRMHQAAAMFLAASTPGKALLAAARKVGSASYALIRHAHASNRTRSSAPDARNAAQTGVAGRCDPRDRPPDPPTHTPSAVCARALAGAHPAENSTKKSSGEPTGRRYSAAEELHAPPPQSVKPQLHGRQPRSLVRAGGAPW